jgi:hypothetical protein
MGDVGGMTFGDTTSLPEFFGAGLRFFEMPGNEHDFGAVAAEHARNALTYALACPCNDHRPAGH